MSTFFSKTFIQPFIHKNKTPIQWCICGQWAVKNFCPIYRGRTVVGDLCHWTQGDKDNYLPLTFRSKDPVIRTVHQKSPYEHWGQKKQCSNQSDLWWNHGVCHEKLSKQLSSIINRQKLVQKWQWQKKITLQEAIGLCGRCGFATIWEENMIYFKKVKGEGRKMKFLFLFTEWH